MVVAGLSTLLLNLSPFLCAMSPARKSAITGERCRGVAVHVRPAGGVEPHHAGIKRRHPNTQVRIDPTSSGCLHIFRFFFLLGGHGFVFLSAFCVGEIKRLVTGRLQTSDRPDVWDMHCSTMEQVGGKLVWSTQRRSSPVAVLHFVASKHNVMCPDDVHGVQENPLYVHSYMLC